MESSASALGAPLALGMDDAGLISWGEVGPGWLVRLLERQCWPAGWRGFWYLITVISAYISLHAVSKRCMAAAGYSYGRA